jgi:hypothetical protein
VHHTLYYPFQLIWLKMTENSLVRNIFLFHSLPPPHFWGGHASLPCMLCCLIEEAAWAFLQILKVNSQRNYYFTRAVMAPCFKKKIGEGGRCFAAPFVTQRSSTLCAPRGRWSGRDSSAGSAVWLALSQYPPLLL